MSEPGSAEAPLRARPVALAHVRPLTVGEMLDAALKLYKSQLKPLFLIVLVFELPNFLIGKAYESAMRTAAPPSALVPGVALGKALHTFLVVGTVLAATIVTILFVSTLARSAVVAAGDEVWHGRPVVFTDAFRRLGRRLGAVLGTYVIFFLLSSLAAFAGAVPGAAVILLGVRRGSLYIAFGGLFLALLGFLAGLLVVFLRYCLIEMVVMLEGKGGPAALRRSARLMSGRVEPGVMGLVKVRASILLLVVFLLLLVPTLVVSGPQLILTSYYSPGPGVMDPLAVPFLMRLPLEVLQIGISSLVAPFGILAMLVFYFDLRVRREGLDLELRAGAMDRAS